MEKVKKLTQSVLHPFGFQICGFGSVWIEITEDGRGVDYNKHTGFLLMLLFPKQNSTSKIYGATYHIQTPFKVCGGHA